MDVIISEIYWTNLSKPGGPVRVLDIQPFSSYDSEPAAYIEHLVDHPYGYAKGTKGWYLCKELRPLTRDEQKWVNERLV